jgi:hypothetical protein
MRPMDSPAAAKTPPNVAIVSKRWISSSSFQLFGIVRLLDARPGARAYGAGMVQRRTHHRQEPREGRLV